ncbi:hypothetical protein [Pararhodospirillum photometricum]|uniref:hypothetical protein n=1 Tax=Pararhodospirillum photometricum TaxID=1084 RepID=UPI0002D50790|nr:hypothetical protein [Pararhodospirillum photometricum]
MTLASDLKSLVDELDRVHRGDKPRWKENGLPNFTHAENGSVRYFNQSSLNAIWSISKILYNNLPPESPKIEIKEYANIIRQIIANMHAAGDFLGFDEGDQGKIIPRFRSLVHERLILMSQEYTHYFPAHTIGVEERAPFSIGPVTVFNRLHWLDSVDIPISSKENSQWKEFINKKINENHENIELCRDSEEIYNFLLEGSAIIKVITRGYEEKISEKFARIIAKSSLDAISLAVGREDCFCQQLIHGERFYPRMVYTLIEKNDRRWSRVISKGRIFCILSPNQIDALLKENNNIISGFGEIIGGVLDPSNYKHPKLANRWVTALDWFGEGCRESNDAIAVAKLATCLDVLSGGGQCPGITSMVAHLTGTNRDEEVTRFPSRTLNNLIQLIYNECRSKTLHGANNDRLRQLFEIRSCSVKVARVSLIEIAERLRAYQGPDESKGNHNIFVGI